MSLHENPKLEFCSERHFYIKPVIFRFAYTYMLIFMLAIVHNCL